MKLPFEEPEGKGHSLTPLIDVVFLLLIFFLVATRFTQEEMDLSIRLAEVFKARPMAAGPLSNRGLHVRRPGRDGHVRPEFFRFGHARRREVGADNVAASRLEQLNRDLPDQSQADHDNRLTQPWIGAPNSLHGDRADRHRASPALHPG